MPPEKARAAHRAAPEPTARCPAGIWVSILLPVVTLYNLSACNQPVDNRTLSVCATLPCPERRGLTRPGSIAGHFPIHLSAASSGNGREESEMKLVFSSTILASAQSKEGGSCPGSRGGNSRSTPPRGVIRARMELARFRRAIFGFTAFLRITRASSSMERPLSAARIRSRVFTSSSRLRIVMLAMLMSTGGYGAQITP